MTQAEKDRKILVMQKKLYDAEIAQGVKDPTVGFLRAQLKTLVETAAADLGPYIGSDGRPYVNADGSPYVDVNEKLYVNEDGSPYVNADGSPYIAADGRVYAGEFGRPYVVDGRTINPRERIVTTQVQKDTEVANLSKEIADAKKQGASNERIAALEVELAAAQKIVV